MSVFRYGLHMFNKTIAIWGSKVMAKRSDGEDTGIPSSVDITDEDVYDAVA